MLPGVAGLVCVITGCSHARGFGWLSAMELRDRGHRVVATMRDTVDRNRGSAAALGRLVTVVEMDVADDTSVRDAVAGILADEGRIDAVVNNAADVVPGALETLTVERLAHVLDVNILGPHRLSLAVLPHMRARGSGVFVQMSSINGYVASPLLGSYATSKFGLEAYSEALSYEVEDFGIRVAIVEPGAFSTGLHERAPFDASADDGPYAGVKADRWDEGYDAWVASMGDPSVVARVIADAVEDPTTPLHVPVGPVAVEVRRSFRPLTDEQVRAKVLGIDLDH